MLYNIAQSQSIQLLTNEIPSLYFYVFDFHTTVEGRTRREQACIGMEMNERTIVTLVEFNQEESIQKWHLKKLIIDMTRKDPRKRIGIQEVCTRLNGT